MANGLTVLDAIGSFAPGQRLRAALFLTYTFDGHWFEQAVAPEVFQCAVETALVIRDRRALIREAPSVRYLRQNALFSQQVFHPKLILLIADHAVLACVGSANLSLGGYQRNLELGHLFEIKLNGEGPRNLFKDMKRYLEEGVRREVAGSSLEALDQTIQALEEVIPYRGSASGPVRQLLLHNYERPLWTQVLETLPHRELERAVIFSPFFDVSSSGEPSEDPVESQDSAPCFERLLTDFTFMPQNDRRPITVCFEEKEGGITNLPLTALTNHRDRIELLARDPSQADSRPLHGKLLILEGSAAGGKKPFCFVLSGSPNFTSAAMLKIPPQGNAELAILTELPPGRAITERVLQVLDIHRRFGRVEEWANLRPAPVVHEGPITKGLLVMREAVLSCRDQMLTLQLAGMPAHTVRLRLSAGAGTDWFILRETDWNGKTEFTLQIRDIFEAETATLPRTLRGSALRLEALSANGAILASVEGPINVDQPHQFNGITMIGPLITTLDQRIAQGACGLTSTYREQQQLIERLRTQIRNQLKQPSVLCHQASLDQFFRNINQGLTGLRNRRRNAPKSAYTLTRVLRDLARWIEEAIRPDSDIGGLERQLYITRLFARETSAILTSALATEVFSKDPESLKKIEVRSALSQAQVFVQSHQDSEMGFYSKEVLDAIADALHSLPAEEVAQ